MTAVSDSAVGKTESALGSGAAFLARAAYAGGRSAPPFAGAVVTLESVTCRDTGQFDLDCDAGSQIHLLNTEASANPLATGRITRSEPATGTPAVPR